MENKAGMDMEDSLRNLQLKEVLDGNRRWRLITVAVRWCTRKEAENQKSYKLLNSKRLQSRIQSRPQGIYQKRPLLLLHAILFLKII